MTANQRTRRYYASPPLAQRSRVELLPTPTFEWREVRNRLVPLLLLVSVIGLYLLQSSFATTSELEIARLARERDAVLHRNIQLAAEIAELEKPSRIRERAYALGLVDTTKSIKLTVTASATEPGSDLSSTSPVDNPSPWQQWLNEFTRWMSQSTKPLH